MKFRSNIHSAMENLFAAQARKRHPDYDVRVSVDGHDEFVTLTVKLPNDPHPLFVMSANAYANQYEEVHDGKTLVRGAFQILRRDGAGANAKVTAVNGPDLVSFAYLKAMQIGMIEELPDAVRP